MESSLRETLVTHSMCRSVMLLLLYLPRRYSRRYIPYLKYVPNTRNFLQMLAGWLASG